MDGYRLDERKAAERIGVTAVTVYDWLAGKDPRMPHVIRAGVLALLRDSSDGTARASQDSSPTSTLTVSEESMSPDDRRAWMRFIELLKHHDTERQLAQWNAVRSVLLVMEPEATAPQETRQRRGKKPALAVVRPAQ
jgi:hypothetical protein